MNQLFRALSDETRRTILEILSERDLTAGEISDCFSLTKPSISHHLNVLKEAGLVMSERKGRAIVYSLNTTVFHEAVKWLFETFGKGDFYEKQ